MIQIFIPPLPDVFGNYALGEFHEVVAPDPISWLPATTGWSWLAAIALLFLVRWLVRLGKIWRANRYRREAMQRLQQLCNTQPNDQFLQALNKLLKLTAMAAFSRQQVAQLSGMPWAEFLNAQCAQAPFSAEQRQWLAQGPYSTATPDAQTRNLLSQSAMQWITSHSSQHDD